MKATNARTALFGPYTLDLNSGELRKFGTKVKMGEQPFQILLILLDRPGEMVTREQLREKLWANDTFVDFDHGLNSAVQRLRDCLSDYAGKPQWIETLPRRGYRFIGQLEWSEKSLSSATHPSPSASGTAKSDDSASLPAPQLSSAGKKDVSGTRIAWALAAGLVLLLAGTLITRLIQQTRIAKRAREIRSLAVLPLENLSGDPAQEYFADGMTDEVITMLAKNPSLRVISRTSVMQYKKVHRPLPEIARELGVDGILEGSVGRSGKRVHVTAQLIHAATDTHVWAESFDRDLSDVGSLQSEVAQTIARQVGATASGTSKPEKRINPEAHDAYLLGRYYWFAGEYEKSGPYFQKAIDLQPDYAGAWSGLADFYAASAVSGKSRPQDVMPQGEIAARKALALDDSLAEVHNSIAAIYLFYRWNWEAAEKESARAVELNPGLAEPHHLRSYVMTSLNREDEALQEQRKAIELDPFSASEDLGWAFIGARRFDDALIEGRIRIGAQPNSADLHYLLVWAYYYKGMEKEAAQEWERALQIIGETKSAAEEEQAFRQGGFQAVLRWNLSVHQQRATAQYVSSMEFAACYANLKRKEETLHYLERSYAEHLPTMVWVQHRPEFDFVHSEPRYRAIVKKMGLPPAY